VHEFALVRSMLLQVDAIVAEQGGSEAEEIRIRCGAFAGVDPTLLAIAFEMLRPGTRWERTRLTIEVDPLRLQCDACGQSFSPDRFRFVCSHCGSPRVHELSGDQVIIESIVIAAADVASATVDASANVVAPAIQDDPS
jgi:hydrogenase nickel incorporation protein HypA/HybF